MNTWIRLTMAVLLLAVAVGCSTGVPEDAGNATTGTATDHMVAQATLVAHYVDAALAAGMSADQINATLTEIAGSTVISEFWVSDENGQVEFTNVPGLDFAFPTDPEAGTQAAPFANLLLGREKVVTQGVMPREADGALFQYVGVAGVDQARIVQVGMAGSQ